MKKILQKKTFYLIAFLIPLAVMTGICIVQGVYPFGRNSFMHCDMYHQYVPFLVEFWRKLHSGESLAYAWNLGLGTDFTAVFAYYLATPTNWLVFFVPEHLIIEFMTFMIVVKIALCGLTFSYYLSSRFRTRSPIVLGFSTLYALSGFVAAYNWNHMWLDVIWLAPLVLLGLERLVKEKKSTLYCAALTASIFTNYYLSIMLCIFLVLYFAVLLFTGGLRIREKAGAIGRFALYSLLAGGMSAVLLFPALSAMHVTEFNDFNFPKNITFYFNALEMLARHFVTIPKEIGLDHWPNIYCGVFLFFLIPMYMFCGKIPLKQRIAKLLLVAFLLLGFSTNLLNFIWHGLNYPDSLPARQSFLYIFLLLTMAFEAVHHWRDWKLPWFIVSLIGAAGLLAACGIFVTTDGFTVSAAALTWVFVAFYVILTVLYLYREKYRLFILWFGLALIVGESAFNMYATSVSVVQRGYYATKWDNYQALLKEAEQDGSFYRFESFCSMTKNDGTLAGYPGVSIFSSTTNSQVADYYDAVGLEGTKVSYYSDGLTAFTSALLGVRYTFSEREEDPALYTLKALSGDMYLYENVYSLPVGFAVSGELKARLEEDIRQGGANLLKLQNDMAAEILGEGVLFIYEGRGEIQPEEEAGAETEEQSEEEKAGPEVSVKIPETGHYYAHIAGDPGDTVHMTVGEETREYDDLKKNCILDLGRQEAGSTLTFAPEEDKTVNLWLYRLDEAVLGAVTEALGSRPLNVSGYRDGYLEGTVTVQEASQLLLSVPHEKGWTVYVDGVKTEYGMYAEAMMAIPLEAGEHHIKMVYSRTGIGAGMAVSAVSLCIFLFLLHARRNGRLGAEGADITETGLDADNMSGQQTD